MNELVLIQTQLKAPKTNFNKFGGYHYRSCEEILEAVKPLLSKHNCSLVISDEIIEVGGRIYVKASATITNSQKETITATAYAREDNEQKGMSAAQLTGSCSSYARKYALNGLFCCDDTKDDDATNTHSQDNKTASNNVSNPKNDIPYQQATQNEIRHDSNRMPTDKQKKMIFAINAAKKLGLTQDQINSMNLNEASAFISKHNQR